MTANCILDGVWLRNNSIMTLPKQSLLKVSTYQNIVFLPETFEALLTSEDKKSSALASFNLARSGKLLKIYVRYNGSHNLGLCKSGFILPLVAVLKPVKVIHVKASADPAIKVLRSIAANKASFRSSPGNLIGCSALRSLLPFQFPIKRHNQTPKIL